MIRLTVERTDKGSTYTTGRLYINREYFCDTLEDTDRGLNFHMSEPEISRIKVYGKTAIPYGIYKVRLSYSPKFKRILPELLNVPGYKGIRIHRGNSDEDTLGCLLVGKLIRQGYITKSTITEEALIKALQSDTEIEIEIK